MNSKLPVALAPVFLMLITAMACREGHKPCKGAITKAPAEVIIEKRETGGWAPLPEEQITPDFRLYDDGRVVYKTYLKPDRSRFELMVGRLETRQADELLKFIRGVGFFEMDEYYSFARDAIVTTITIRHTSQHKTVQVEGLAISDLDSFKTICNKLNEFRAPRAQKYKPEEITIFVQPVQIDPSKLDPWTASVDLDQASKAGNVTLQGDKLNEVVGLMKDVIPKSHHYYKYFCFQGKAYYVVAKIHFPDE